MYNCRAFIVRLMALSLHAPLGLAAAPDHWRQAGADALQQALARRWQGGHAGNVILFLGDGMGPSTVTAARILAGQQRGETGEENQLAFERLPFLGMARTYNTNQQVPDSAGTMTAIMTGVKTRAGLISVDERALRGDCAGSRGRELPTLLEQFEQAGRATGVVTTARLTHATPAATYAHAPDRDWEDDSLMPAAAREQGCRDIAQQLIALPQGDGLEVALGGGRRGFLPRRAADPEYPGSRGARQDGRDLTREWLTTRTGAAYVWNRRQLAAIDPDRVEHLLGLFEPSHMQYESDRAQDGAGEPSLSEMTRLAIRILRRNPRGFFLMVEGGRIDHGHHAGNAYRALQETIEFARAVSVALQDTDSSETLIVVTADHSHVLTLGGYPTRGNPILGKVVENDAHGEPEKHPALDARGMPYTTVGYINGPGFAIDVDPDTREKLPPAAGRRQLAAIDTAHPNFYQESLVPLSGETHGGEDVAIYASGPWAHLFQRSEEQSYIYQVMVHASLGQTPAPAGAASRSATPE